MDGMITIVNVVAWNTTETDFKIKTVLQLKLKKNGFNLKVDNLDNLGFFYLFYFPPKKYSNKYPTSDRKF